MEDGNSHGGQRRSHRVPICKALYNHAFRQVVSGDDESSVCVWDVTCGALNFMFHNAHDRSKITFMCFDHGERRLFTGAHDGSLKLWNFSNGNCLKSFDDTHQQELDRGIGGRAATGAGGGGAGGLDGGTMGSTMGGTFGGGVVRWTPGRRSEVRGGGPRGARAREGAPAGSWGERWEVPGAAP